MRIIFLLLFMIFIGCCNSPTEQPTPPEPHHSEGVLVDLTRITIDMNGYPVRAWVILATGISVVLFIQVESITEGWLIPIYIAKSDTVLIPEQTNISIYSKYTIEWVAK